MLKELVALLFGRLGAIARPRRRCLGTEINEILLDESLLLRGQGAVRHQSPVPGRPRAQPKLLTVANQRQTGLPCIARMRFVVLTMSIMDIFGPLIVERSTLRLMAMRFIRCSSWSGAWSHAR